MVGGGGLKDWHKGTPESVVGGTHGEGQNFSEGGGFFKIVANGGSPPVLFTTLKETLH